MDGVIVDSEPLHEATKRQALHSAGIEVSDSVFARYTGRTDRAMITDIARAYGRSDEEIEGILSEKHRLYELGESNLKPIPGAIEFLLWAREHYQLALATSATRRNLIATLEHLQIADVFDVVLDSSSVNQPKPSPKIYEKALAGLDLPSEVCWVIEDSLNGIVAARDAHCFAIGLSTSFSHVQLLAAGANLAIDRYRDLQHFLRASVLVRLWNQT